MRKHSHSLVGRRVIAGVSLALGFTACNKSERAISQSRIDSASVVPFAATGSAGAVQEQRKSIDEVVADAAMASSPTVALAARANGTPAAERFGFGSGPLLPASDLSGAMLVRHGEASVEVHRVEDALARVRQTAAQFGGFVANTAVRNGKDEQPSATLELRVPTAQFDALLGALNTLGKVETVTANVQDVGEEYVDIGARAANARRMEARLVEMLATRTGKLSDVLTVEQELRRVREEIERYEARLRYLERHAAVSSLDVTLHEPLALIDRPRPGPIVEAVGMAWERMLGVIAWCIASLGLLVPLGVLIGLGVMVLRRLQWSRFRPSEQP